MSNGLLSIDYIKSLPKDIKRDILNRGTLGVQNLTDKEKQVYDTMISNQKSGVKNFNEGGLSGPQYKIDPQFYNSPEYEELMNKRREANKTGGNVSGFAMTYSPYFGMSNTTSIKQDDMAYEAYVKRIGGNPKADFGSAAFTTPENTASQQSKYTNFDYNSIYSGQDLRDLGIARGMTEAYVNALTRGQMIQALENSDAGKPLPLLYPRKVYADPPSTTTDQLISEIMKTQSTPEPETPPAAETTAQPAAETLSPAAETTPPPAAETTAQPEPETPPPAAETVTTALPPEEPVTQVVGADPRNTGVVFDPTAGSNVAAENQQNTQSGTSATTPQQEDSSIDLGDIGEAALPFLGVAAVDFLDGDGELDFGKILSSGAALGTSLGLDLFQKLGDPAGGADKIGYQGTIPTYAATRRQVPVDYSTGRRPGSGGRRYFTDMRYTAPSGIASAQQAAQADATALQQMNQANPLNQPPVQTMNMGGIAGAASRYLNSSADGMADTIPSSIDNRDPAALSGGEFVVAADVVSGLGNGNSNAGAKQLYDMMDRVRKARTGTTKQGKQIKPNSVMPV